MTDFDPLSYSNILFMDSMVALEGKPLPDQPWHEIDQVGPILVLVVPQVLAEIDKRKRDGRLGRRAREFNRLIGPAAESGMPRRICDGPPIVDLAVAICAKIDWSAFDDLDPDEADAKVVAQILHVRGIEPERKLLFSQDINPIAMASRHKLKCKKMPEHWLVEPEPSPNDKELSRLRSRVKELEATEPQLSAVLEFGINADLTLHSIRPLPEDIQQELASKIQTDNPRIEQRRTLFDSSLDYDYSYNDRYRKYCEVVIPTYVQTLHRRFETHYNQIPFVLQLENSGYIQADNLVATLKAIGGTLNDRFVVFPLFGPSAPQPENSYLGSFVGNMNQHIVSPVGRHEMRFAVGPDRGPLVEIHCADFRHGRVWRFDGIALIDPRAGSPFRIEVTLTASNLRGRISREFDLAYNAKDVSLEELVDLDKREYHVEIPMHMQFDKALDARDRNWLQLVEDEAVDDDEDEEEAS
ncbi:MAG: hypothetical protein KIT82_14845 [Bradyrhizobium sp.]|nr:hypothetical protein [Bradyrhizobium sp.]